MADGERSPLLSDLGDGALGSGNGGVSPGAGPYGVPNKPPSEYICVRSVPSVLSDVPHRGESVTFFMCSKLL